jgi:2-hydroxy-6-oxonona-2,4-dienedioate hydrolase
MVLADLTLSAKTQNPRLNVCCDGNGPALVLIHGGMGSWNHWIRNIEVLAPYFRVHAIDLPGYGESPPVDREMSGDDFKDLVCRAIDGIVGEGAPFRLAGFSFGGAISSHIAARMGDRVKSLTLIGASGFGRIKNAKPLNTRSYKDAGDDQAMLRDIVRNNLLAFMLNDTADDHAVDCHAANVKRTRFDSRKVSGADSQRFDLQNIQCPLQIIWGEDDVTARPSVAERVKLCQSVAPNLRFDMVRSAAHWTMYDSAEAVNDLMLDFIPRSDD